MEAASFTLELTGDRCPAPMVSTDWVQERRLDPSVRMVEVDADSRLYANRHLPGGVNVVWQTELQDPIRRDVIDRAGFATLLNRLGIAPETTVVLYGDHSNVMAAYAFWIFTLYGHQDVRIMDGGRRRWERKGYP